MKYAQALLIRAAVLWVGRRSRMRRSRGRFSHLQKHLLEEYPTLKEVILWFNSCRIQ
jgi:hypothetical protein